MSDDVLIVTESGNGPYAELVSAGRHVMAADEPEALGGRDTGASPYQYLMAGLGACTAMTLRGYAFRHAWPVGKITVRLWHKKIRAANGATIDEFRRDIEIAGELTEEQMSLLMAVAENCPVSQTLQRQSVVVSRFSVAVPTAATDTA